MPTYQYACTDCDHRFDQVQSFSDPSLTVCPACSGRLRKVFSSVGIVFKGSGFYRTDSRAGAVPPEGRSESKPDAKGETKTEVKSSSESSSSSSSSSDSSTSSSSSSEKSSSSSGGSGSSSTSSKAAAS